MYKLKSLDSFELKNRGIVYIVESPVECDRKFSSIIQAIGPVVEIDGTQQKIIAIEMKMPGSRLHIGERIGILVVAIKDE